jgi:hypothetical protein
MKGIDIITRLVSPDALFAVVAFLLIMLLQSAGYIDRIEAILIPLLRNLEEYYQDESFTTPSLVQFQSGLWDTRRWSEEDIAAQSKNDQLNIL